jgi:outer membrane receptor protein involved in Fe transport
MTKILSILLVILTVGNAFSRDNDPEIKDGKVKGIVIDSDSMEPVEYATVALYASQDNTLITGSISDFTGHFKIDGIEPNTYYLIISFIGYQDLKTDDFKIDIESRNIDLGRIILKSLSKELETFNVVEKKDAIEYRIDKKVINVDKQITSEAGTAVDILENVPSVQVGVEGNVTLRGSSGFTVLIDGKPTIMEPSDVLRQIPSSSIENIEIITNPSVKYDPDGATGIINIITKKNPLEGLSGIVNANVGMYDQYGGDFQLSYRMNKFNFVLGANYNKRGNPGFTTNNRISTKNDTISHVNSSGDAERGRTTASTKFGIEYNPTKNDFVSVSAGIGKWGMKRSSVLRYDDWTNPETDFLSYTSKDKLLVDFKYYSFDGLYQHNFVKKVNPNNTEDNALKGKGAHQKGKRPGFKSANVHSLKFEINFRNNDIDESSTNELRDLNGVLIGARKNLENGPSESLRFNIDYTLPLKEKDKFEAGMRWRKGKSNDETELWLYNTLTGDIIIHDEFSNSTVYYRDIYSAYALYAGVVKKFGYQIGLRTEYTNRKVETTKQDPFLIDRWDYFPTLHVSYELPKDQQMMASYSRRIDRPRSYWLEPFITWVDAYNVRSGNPELKPEYIDSYDLSYIKKFENSFLSLEGYYRITQNKVERVSSVYTTNVLLTRPENVGQDYSLGVEAMFSLSPTKWWDMELSANLFNYRLDGELTYIQEDKVVVEKLDRNSTNWNSRFNNTFKMWEKTVFQLNSRYNSSSVTAQGTSSGFFTLDAAFKMSFFKKTLSANLQGRNLLGTAIRERTSEGLGFSSYSKYEPKSPVFVISVSYRFNNFKQSRRSSNSGDEL